MSTFTLIAVFISLAALLSFLNYRFLKLPTTVGLMLASMLMSLGVIGVSYLGLDVTSWAEKTLTEASFSTALMEGMLSFLLFAGALGVNLEDLAKQKWIVGSLATIGVVVSTGVIGTIMYFILPLLGLDLPLVWCLTFGALISPTDPVAVLSILKSAKVPRSLETKIAGESLFNDGVGVVVFLVLVGIVTGGHDTGLMDVAELFVIEAIGGIIFGFIIGLLAYWLLKQVNQYSVEVLLTLGLVSGGYSLASALHVSGPIAIVVAGLFIGNRGRLYAMSEETRHHLDTFWELVDEVLNAVLFVWIGLEVLIIALPSELLLAGALAIPAVLGARLFAVSAAVNILRFRREFSPNTIKILTWGGLRGGISIALALSLPPGPERSIILGVTYVVVVFSILVQGLTVQRLVKA